MCIHNMLAWLDHVPNGRTIMRPDMSFSSIYFFFPPFSAQTELNSKNENLISVKRFNRANNNNNYKTGIKK